MKITTCPKHKIRLRLELIATGGCQGHSENEYCYCDSIDMHAELFCPGVNDKHCGHRIKVVPGMTDADAIARWIADRIERETRDDST